MANDKYTDKPKRPGFGQRVNAWLAEAPGKTFKDGKWRFWFPALIGLGMLNAVLTGLIFHQSGNLQNYMGGIVCAVGVLLGWLGVGALHYSDEVVDAQLARGVSLLDSATLLFVVAHFCFLLWAYGHFATLQNAEADYKAQAEKFNAEASKVSQDNVKIAEAARAIAAENTKAERLKNDTAYQTRKAAERGARIPGGAASASMIAPSLSTQAIQLERPKAPEESSTKFLSEWDKWIRLTNFGELLLAVVTLVYIRNRSAKFNAQYAPTQMNFHGERTYRVLPDGRREIIHSSYSGDEIGKIVEPDEDFPSKIETSERGTNRNAPLRQERQERQSGSKIATSVATHVATDQRARDLEKLREHLKAIAFNHPGRWFKADVIEGGGVWVRMCERQEGREVTIAKTKQSDGILESVDHPKFREVLIKELTRKGFPLEKGRR
jgi:hypothetical protein